MNTHNCEQNIESNMTPAHCRVCKKPVQTSEKGWEDVKKEIMNELEDSQDKAEFEMWLEDPTGNDFIHRFLLTERSKLLHAVTELAEGMKKVCTRCPGDESQCADCGIYNQALSDFLSKLEATK